MTDWSAPTTVHRKEFDNGDLAFYTDADNLAGLQYYAAEGAIYSIETVTPPPNNPADPHSVELHRFSVGPTNAVCEQALKLAEYPSQMAAEEHAHEIGQTLLDQGLAGLQPEVERVALMPNLAHAPIYLMGLYPPSPAADVATLNLIRLDGPQIAVAPIARGEITAMAAIEQRLFAIQAEGDTDVFLKAATAEAVRAQTLAPNTSLFAAEGAELQANPAHSWLPHLPPAAWEDHPGWPDTSAWEKPAPPRPAALVLPVTFDADLTPFDEQGQYVPHHIDEDQTVHFFAVIPRPVDSPLPDDTTHELRYYRAQIDEAGLITHHSLPVMSVDDPTESPWPLPALQLHLEEGEVDIAQVLARDIARDMYGLDFPDPDNLPALGQGDLEPLPEWYHYDAALVLATPQGVDDGYSVGVVDVYANQTDGQWAARYLPMGEFDTFDEALAHQQHTLQQRVAADRASAFSASGFNASPALYEHLVEQTADAALTDLMEQNDGELPLDYEADPEPEWERLTSKEWDAYRDHVQGITRAIPDTDHMLDMLPTATPQLAGEELITASIQPDTPYLQAADFVPHAGEAPRAVWQVDVVPAQHPDGDPLGYSAIFVNHPTPSGPEQSQWLEIGQFDSDERAQQFRQDFLALAQMDDLQPVAEFAELVADEMQLSQTWQPLTATTRDLLKTGDWTLTHTWSEWHPLGEVTSPLVELEPDTAASGSALEL